MKAYACLVLVCLTLPGFTGCATHADRAKVVRNAFYQGQLQTALEKSTPQTGWLKRQHDDDLQRLNQAMIHLASGDSQQSEQLLREVRDRFDHLEQKSLAEQTLALLSDDRRISYAGEEYERILIRVMLALSNLMHEGGDVHAYALQVAAKQQEMLQTKQVSPPQETSAPPDSTQEPPPPDQSGLASQLAIGSYLRAAVLESSPLDYDDVQRCRLQVASWQPDFRDAQIDLARAESGQHSAPGHGVVYLFALVGQGPYKEEDVAPVTTVSLLIADRILSAVGKYELPPNIAPVRIPVVVRAPQLVDNIAVASGGVLLGSTATLMNVGELAVQQQALERDRIIARAVARRIAKKGSVYAVKEGLRVEGSPEIDMLLTVAGIVWEASERADTRCWSLLPDRIQVLRLELPIGEQELTLTPQRDSRQRGTPQRVRVDVQDAKSTFVLTCIPHDRPVGQILVSDPR